MADITKCKGGNCTMKYTCYRFLAEDNEYRQSYFMKVPSKGLDENNQTICDEYWLRDKIERIKINIDIKDKI